MTADQAIARIRAMPHVERFTVTLHQRPAHTPGEAMRYGAHVAYWVASGIVRGEEVEASVVIDTRLASIEATKGQLVSTVEARLAAMREASH
jgi:hypothetical protein